MANSSILGLKYPGHDTAAALVRDGKIVGAAAQERFDRKKHSASFPADAIEYCLASADLAVGDIDHIAFQIDPLLTIRTLCIDNLVEHFPRALPLAAHELGYQLHKFLRMRLLPARLGARCTVHVIDHHRAHAASAFYCSPFTEAAVMTVDGRGERATATLGIGKGDDLTTLEVVNYPHSLGYFYAAITKYLGFQPDNDEGTVMALAACGEPRYASSFRNIVQLTDDGFRLDMRYFSFHLTPKRYLSPLFLQQFGPARKPQEELVARHSDIAASAQVVLEEAVLHLARRAKALTGMERLCVAGGIGLNSVANGRLLREAGFRDVFIQPAAGDDGSALGAALALHRDLSRQRPEPNYSVYLGPSYDDSAVRNAIVAAGLTPASSSDICRDVAQQLCQGRVGGWFQGRMEFGPRALGNRSILATCAEAATRDRINNEIKHRESFRPFAPAVLEDCASEFFECCRGSPYMLLVYPVRGAKKDVIPAAMHVDGSARVQTVNAAQNPLFYRLIAAVGEMSGVPVVLNTSLNGRGEPIVNEPCEALALFKRLPLDFIALGNYLVTRQ
jgi:carbamoyltransferase